MTTIDITLDPPNPLTDTQSAFNVKALAFTQALNPWAAQVNTVAGEVNTNKLAAADSASAAANAATDAAAQKTLAQGYASDAATQASLAASSAGSAVNAPGTSATSTTTISVSAGSASLTIQTGKAFAVGQFVVVASTASPANYMAGQITGHNAGTGSLTINATHINGSGSYSDWTISVVGAPAAGGVAGDIIYTTNTMDAPNYLPCDGATYLKSSYPVLSNAIGTVGLFDNPVPLTSLPTGLTAPGEIYATTWSPDSQYLAVAGSTLRAMKRNGEALDNITITSGTSNTALGAAFDKVDGTYLGEAGSNSPYVKFHKRTGDTFAALSNPASLPPGACTVIDCTPDGVYWAVATIESPYLVIYKRTGDSFVKLANPATMPGSSLGGLSFSHDGQYLAVSTRLSAPYIMLYQRSGDTFTAITFPGVMPTGGDMADVKFDPTGRYFSARNAAAYSKTVFIYDIQNGWSLSSVTLATPSESNNLTAQMAWSSDGKYLLVPDNTSFELRDVENGFSLLPTPPTGPRWTSTTQCGPSFSPDNMFLVFAGQSANACVWKRRYDPKTLFATPRVVGAKAYIKT